MQDIDTKIFGDETECLCPKCRTIHIKKMNWIGRGIPRKFCPNCEWVRDTYGAITDDLSQYHAPRMAPGWQPERRNTN